MLNPIEPCTQLHKSIIGRHICPLVFVSFLILAFVFGYIFTIERLVGEYCYFSTLAAEIFETFKLLPLKLIHHEKTQSQHSHSHTQLLGLKALALGSNG